MLAKAATLGGDVAGVVVGSGVQGARRRGRRVRREEGVRRRRRARSRRRSRSRASTCSRSSCATAGIDTVLFAAVGARRRRRRRARRAARRRPQLGPRRPRRRRRRRSSASARRSATPCSSTSAGRRRRASRSSAPARSTRARPAGRPRSRTSSRRARGLLDARRRWSSRRTPRAKGPSIEDADVIVAGGRGLGGPENFTLVEELAQALGGAVARDARGRRRGLVPVRDAGRPDGQDGLAEALRRAAASRARSSTRSACRARARSSRSTRTPNAPIFEFGDLGVVGDVHEIVPKLTELVRAAQGVTIRPPPTSRRRSSRRECDRGADRPGRRADRGRRPDRRRGPGRPRLRDPPRPAARGGTRASRSGSATCRSRCSRRASSPARTCSPARSSTRARCARLFGGPQARRRLPFYGPVEGESVYFLTRQRRAAHPGAADDAEPRQLRRLALAARPLARRARPRRPARRSCRRPRRRSCSSSTAASSACAPATRAAAATASRCRTSSRAPTSSRASPCSPRGRRATSPAPRSSASGSQGENPQVWALGVKEVWRSREPLDRVIHTMGWPLRTAARYREFGGSFIYPMGDDMVTIGMVVGLDYRDAELSVHDLLQELKTHPLVRRILEGGERIEWGAKTIPEGGFLALPRAAARARPAALRRRRRARQRAGAEGRSTTRSSPAGSRPRPRSRRCSAGETPCGAGALGVLRRGGARELHLDRPAARCATCARRSAAASGSAARSRAR